MIFALLLQAAPSLDALPQQALPATGCAAYLWSVADRRFIAMANADPPSLRLQIDGKPVDLARTTERGTLDYGLAGTTSYVAGDVSVTLDLTIARHADLIAGASVPSGTLAVVRSGGDSAVVPVAGLIGCR